MLRFGVTTFGLLATTLLAQPARAVSSAELYTAAAYSYGRVESRMRFAAGDGVVSSFFSWKDGSEQAGTFWNELDFEKVGADCRLETNPIYGNPSANHSQRHTLALDLCGGFHVYAYEWTPEAIVWLVDGEEIRRETGATAQAYADNAGQPGMQIHFNLWPGDASFGGNFDPAILPVHEYVDWVQFSAWEGGELKLSWREDFDQGALPAGWLTGSWESPKAKSTHAPENVNFIDGFAVLSLTADDAKGPAGAAPNDSGGGSAGASNAGGSSAGTAAGSPSAGASPNGGASPSGGGGTTDAGTASVAAGTASGGAPTGTPSATAAGSASEAPPTSGGCSIDPSRGGGAWLCHLGWVGLAGWLVRRRRSPAVHRRT